MNNNNINEKEPNNKAKQVKDSLLTAWYDSTLRKVLRFIALCSISFSLLISLFIVALPLFNLSFLDSYINEYMAKHTNLIFHIDGKIKMQIVPKFHLYIQDLTIKQKPKNISDSKWINRHKKNFKQSKFEKWHNRIQNRTGFYYSSKDLNLVMPISKMLRTDFRVDKISASKFDVGYNKYHLNFKPLLITNDHGNFKIVTNGKSQNEKILFQAKFKSLSPQDIRGNIHLNFKNMDLKFRIDKYSIGEPLQGYFDFNSKDLYDLVHLWGFGYHTQAWGLKGDINVDFRLAYQEDVYDEIRNVTRDLRAIAIKEPNKVNIAKSGYQRERDLHESDIFKFLDNVKAEVSPVVEDNNTNDDNNVNIDSLDDTITDTNTINSLNKDNTDDEEDDDDDDQTIITNVIFKSKAIHAYYTSRQGFKATGVLKDVTYDLSGRTTHATAYLKGYKGGTAHAEMLKGGGLHMPMVINATIHGNDINEVLGVVGYPYHSKKVNVKARVILKYPLNRNAGVYVDHITSDITSTSDELGHLTGNFFYGWDLGELYSDAIVHNKQNVATAKIYIKKFYDPIIFETQGHGQTFSDIMKVGNIPLFNTLNKWNLKTKVKITNHDIMISPIWLKSTLYHKSVFIDGQILQNFHRKFHLSNLNIKSGKSKASIIVSNKDKGDFHVKIHGSGRNVKDLTKIFNLNLTSQAWESNIDLSIPINNKQTSIMINQMDTHIHFNKDMDFKTRGIAELNYKSQHLIGNVRLNFNDVPINLGIDNVDNKNILTFSAKGRDLNRIYKLGDLKFKTKSWSTSGNITLPYDWQNGTLLLDNMKTHIKTTTGFNLETLSDTKIHLKNLTTDSNVKITSGDNNFYAKVIRDSHESIIAYIHGKGTSLRNILSFVDSVNLDDKWNIKGNIFWNPKHGKSLFVKKINMQIGNSDLKGDVIFDGSKVLKETDVPDVLVDLTSQNINLNDFKSKVVDKKKQKVKSKLFSKEKFDLGGIKKWHVKGNVHLNNLQTGLLKVTNANMYITSKSGIITAKGKLYINSGFADALLRLNTQTAYPQLRLKLNINDMALEEVAKMAGVNGLIHGGVMKSQINLFTFGKSSYEMASNINGIVQGTVGSGEIVSTLLNFASMDIISSPLTLIQGSPKYRKLLCGAVNLKIKNGKISGAPLLALKTKGIDITLSGTTDIAKEYLRSRLIIYSREGLGLSLTNITGGYDIKGPYNNIQFGKSLVDIIEIGAKGTVAWFTFGGSILANSLLQKTLNTANVCTLVMNN